MGLENFGPADLKSLVGTDQNSMMGGGMGIWLVLLVMLLGGRGNLLGGLGGVAGTDAVLNNGFGNRNNNLEDKFLDFETFEKINDVATQNVQNFMGLGQQVTTSQFAVQQEINGVRSALAQCCCENQLAIRDSETRTAALIDGIEDDIADLKSDMDQTLCDIKNQAALNTRDIIDEVEDSKDEVIGFLTQTKIDELTAENAILRNGISQADQTAAIVAAINASTAAALATVTPAA